MEQITSTEQQGSTLTAAAETSAPAPTAERQRTIQGPRKMSRAEAGRKGGLRTKERHGEDYFGRIGKMGGKKGGESTKERYGVEFYRTIGRKGGSR
ncbi:MAG: hypothetical protein NVSMB57_00650 [Actinomycetota bacterium]